MSHAMYNDTREDLKHVESELEKDKEVQEKWKNEQNGNDENIMASESIPDTTMKLENSNTVIANRDKTESVTVVKILMKMKKMKSSEKAKEEKQKQKERKKRSSLLFDKKK